MHIHAYTYIYIHIYIYIYIHIHIHIHTYTHTCIRTYVHIYIYNIHVIQTSKFQLPQIHLLFSKCRSITALFQDGMCLSPIMEARYRRGKSWLGILMVNGLLMLVNLCWGKWVTSLIKDMLVNILLLYFSLFLQKHLKNWTWWRKTFNLRRRRFWHAVRVVLKNTHTSHHHIITSSHRKFRYAEFILWFTTFFAVSLLLTF